MKILPLIFINFYFLLFFNISKAHEIFSVRADTVRQNGISTDSLMKYEKAGSQYEAQLFNKLMFGINENLTLELNIPIFLNKKISEFTQKNHNKDKFLFEAAGLGKCELLSKIRIFYDFGFQKRNQIVALSGILFPTSPKKLSGIDKKPIIGNNSIDFLLGTAASFETVKFYNFASLLYQINSTNRSIHEGNQLFYSYAFGYRPKKPDINKIDWVFLVDFDGIWSEKIKVHKKYLSDSGSNIIFAGPSFFCSKGNLMLKGSFQFPIIQYLDGIQEKNDFRCLLGLFLQF